MKRLVVVKYQFEGCHKWKDCPFSEVSFLRDKHRHIFHVRAEKEVQHNDRDIEIIMLKREMELFSRSVVDYGDQSCEQIAENLLHKFNLTSCEVLEDNENGAKITI